MNEILVAIVGAAGIVLVALISNRGRQHAKAARDQVQNSHSTNLREEMDERHAQTQTKLNELVDWQTIHQGKISRNIIRLTRIEALVLPLLTATLAAGVIRLTQRKARP
ncbi:DUF2746 domain-containing protein [Agromyces laixinhei]|uniref:DUF2746 domain-containing protein n=1 Tax=Agromyces laixinhei TaxID=2585717 RepID=UPI0012EE779E|nr:DUF2746 domain-containing protein [Agromyces laixinhei]